MLCAISGNTRSDVPMGSHGARLLRFGVEVLLLLLVIGQVSCLVVLHSVAQLERSQRILGTEPYQYRTRLCRKFQR